MSKVNVGAVGIPGCRQKRLGREKRTWPERPCGPPGRFLSLDSDPPGVQMPIPMTAGVPPLPRGYCRMLDIEEFSWSRRDYCSRRS